MAAWTIRTSWSRINAELEKLTSVGLTVTNEVTIEPKPQPNISLWMAPDHTFLFSGSVPIGEGARLRDLVTQSIPSTTRLVDDLTESRFVARVSWYEELSEFFPLFAREAQRCNIRIAGNKVLVEGIAKSSSISSVRRRINATFPSPRFEVEAKLSLGVPTERKLDLGEPRARAPKDLTELALATRIYFGSGRSRVSQLKASERGQARCARPAVAEGE